MPRQRRIASETGVYHIMVRGINKQKIFEHQEDYQKYLQFLSDCKEQVHFDLYAYCLMPNHVHLLLRTEFSDLERIMKRLHERHIPFSKLDKADSIRRWNSGEIPVALIHPASAGHGLNLQTGGNTIVWFGLTWSLELYSQTIARLWRQGQTAETVVVQHIVTDGTIDEQILRALKAKDKTQSALIAAVKANLKI
jgi:REP element-mobilizing transposase RayT